MVANQKVMELSLPKVLPNNKEDVTESLSALLELVNISCREDIEVSAGTLKSLLSSM